MSYSEAASFLAINASIYGLFRAAGRAMRAPAAEHLKSWLKGDVHADESWGSTYVSMFDALFSVESGNGSKGRSTRRSRMPSPSRSFLVSTLAVALMYVIYWSLLPEGWGLRVVPEGGRPNVFLPLDLVHTLDGVIQSRVALETAIVFPILVNLLPDYLSLIETRWVLGYASRGLRLVGTVGIVLLDLVLTVAIAWLSYSLVNAVYWWVFFDDPFVETFAKAAFLWFWPTLVEFGRPDGPYGSNEDGAYIYSTFVTSAWLWLFLLTTGLLWVVRAVPLSLKRLDRMFALREKIEHDPASVLGALAAGAFSVAALSASFVVP